MPNTKFNIPKGKIAEFGIDEETVWRTVKEKIPKLKSSIEKILSKLSDEKS